MVLSEIPTKTRYEAKTDIINSIALMEAGIASILEGESDKLKSANGTNINDPTKKLQANSLDQLLKVNSSIESTVTSLTMLETLLHKKLALVNDDASTNP